MDDQLFGSENIQPFEDEPVSAQGRKKGNGRWVVLVAAAAILGGIAGALLQPVVMPLLQENTHHSELRVMTPPEIYEHTVQSVVGVRATGIAKLYGIERETDSTGTGLILTEDGFLLTNHHVIKLGENITVSLYDGRELEAEVIASDEAIDIALLKVEAEELRPVDIGSSKDLRVGEPVYAVGNPLGDLSFTMTAGIVSALDRRLEQDGYYQHLFQADTAINSGNSGGPMFDCYGRAVGVIVSKYSGLSSGGSTLEGLGFAIPMEKALQAALELYQYGFVRGRAYLGISVVEINEELASVMGTPAGPRVTEVASGACAERYGLQVNDILQSFDGKELQNVDDFLSAVSAASAGETVVIGVYRDGEELELSVTLDEKLPELEEENS